MVRKDNISLVRYVYCMIILFLPVNVISRTSIYSVTTPDTIWYKYRSFDFSIFAIPLLIYAFITVKSTFAIPFHKIIIAIGIKDVIFYVIGQNNTAIKFDFSLYLILIISWAITVIVLNGDYDDEEIPGERFLDCYFLLAFASIILRFMLRMTTEGRYGAIGLSVGGTGFFSAVYIIYILYVHEYKKTTPIILTMAFITLILSGQRTNLLFCILFCIPYVILNMQSKRISVGNRRKALLLRVLLCIGLVAICAFLFLDELGVEIQGMSFITRTLDSVSRLMNNDISGEASVEGRYLSIEAGLSILKTNILGITNVFYDLQHRMTRLNYPTYPHSSCLDCALLWSTPITLFCELWLIRLLIKLARKRVGMFWVVLYIQILMLLWGSPFLDYPMLFIILLLLSMARVMLVHDDRILENIDYEYIVSALLQIKNS